MIVEWSKPDFGKEEIEAANRSLSSFIGGNGPEVKLLEREFAQRVGSSYAVAVCNGTSALIAALLSVKKKYNPTKIGVPSYTFIASANSAYSVFGDSIELIDANINSWNIDPNNLPKDIDILMSVDVGGLSCDYDELKLLDIPIVADSAESLGSLYKNNIVGTQCDIHCFSLHRSKIVSCGEGGMITTNSEELYETVKSIVNHGYDKNKKPHEYKHSMFGLNFRMCDVNAAIARAQLQKLDQYVNHRNLMAEIYKNELSLPMQTFDSNYKSNYFFFGVLVDNKEDFILRLKDKGISTKSWSSVNSNPIWKHKNNDNLYGSRFLSDHAVLLPIHNTITEKEVAYVCSIIKDIR